MVLWLARRTFDRTVGGSEGRWFDAVVLWLARRTFDRTVGGSEGRWFEARLVSSLLCCFLRQETLLHIVSLHPGV